MAVSSISSWRPPSPRSTLSSARRTIGSISASPSARSVKTRTRDSSAALTSNDGFSVVAPIKVTVPFSACGRTASCWALFQRWTSSMNRIVRSAGVRRASSTTLRRSATPAVTADMATNRERVRRAMTSARVVLPDPGGPHRTMLGTLSASSARRSARPGASRCSCPRISSRPRGLIRAASERQLQVARLAASGRQTGTRLGAHPGRVTVGEAALLRTPGNASAIVWHTWVYRHAARDDGWHGPGIPGVPADGGNRTHSHGCTRTAAPA